VVEVLADVLEVATSAIELVSGATSPQKKFLIRGLDIATVRDRLDCAIAGA
jgi:uncharacterized protein YggU (UPF0235/DUF167 family)